MRSISECKRLESSYDMTMEERSKFREWIDKEARYMYDSCDLCYLLGWFLLDQDMPISPKEAGFD